MFSGKTTLLIELMNKLDPDGIAIKPSIDNRTKGDFISTHNGITHSAQYIDCNNLSEFKPKSHMIWIDEGQFFTGLKNCVELWINNGHDVYVAGLDKDFRGNLFPEMKLLMPIANTLKYMYGECNIKSDSCTQKADHTYRIISDNNLILIGGEEFYQPACKNCFGKVQNFQNSQF